MERLARELDARSLIGRSAVITGEPAPNFALPALHEDRTIALADYRGQSALFLAIERGLFCPFCRMHMAQLGRAREKLRGLGADALVVVGTPRDRARAYLAMRSLPVPMVADPGHTTHEAYGLPRFAHTPEIAERYFAARINPFDDLPEPKPIKQLAEELSRDDPYEWTPADQQAYDVGQLQSTGQFLIDREGIVRWANVEGASDGLAGVGRFPSEKEILTAVLRATS